MYRHAHVDRAERRRRKPLNRTVDIWAFSDSVTGRAPLVISLAIRLSVWTASVISSITCSYRTYEHNDVTGRPLFVVPL